MRDVCRVVCAAAVLAVPVTVSAQVVISPATAKVDFASVDHTALIPAGFSGEGNPLLVSYQGMVFPGPADPSSGVPLIVGPVIPKTAVTVGTLAPFRLTLGQMGLTAIPPCTVVAPTVCPSYSVVIVSLGPGGTSARAVAAESDPFTLAALLPTLPPVGPTLLRIVP